MDQIYNEYDLENVVVRGYVRYRDYTPVKGAIVILEKMISEYNEVLQQEERLMVYHSHTLTNQNGEFSFLLMDRTSIYKIKVFDNHHH